MRTSVVFLLPTLLAVAACSSNSVAPGNQSVNYGSYAGKVVLHSVRGDTVSDQSGATVTLNGTHYSTMTNADGKYELDDIPTGTYTLTFTKPGFDTAIILADRFTGVGTSTMLTQDLQMIPYDSIVCDSVQYYFDWTGKNPDTVSVISFLGKIMYRSLARGEDSVYAASLRIVRENAVGDTTVVVSGNLLQLYPTGTGTFQTYLDSTLMRNRRVRVGDKLAIYFRAAAMPLTNSPVTFSPFVTRKEVVVQ